jgi:hypothetical protein
MTRQRNSYNEPILFDKKYFFCHKNKYFRNKVRMIKVSNDVILNVYESIFNEIGYGRKYDSSRNQYRQALR